MIRWPLVLDQHVREITGEENEPIERTAVWVIEARRNFKARVIEMLAQQIADRIIEENMRDYMAPADWLIRPIGPEDEFDDETNGDPDSLLGEEDERGYDDMPVENGWEDESDEDEDSEDDEDGEGC